MTNKLLAPGIAFVTGGARGLGNAVAVSFAKAGAKGVVIVDILDDATLAAGAQKVESYGATVRSHRLQYSKYIIIIIAIKCLAIQADVTKEEDIESAIAQTVSKFGRIDYAANFAGTGGQGGPVTDMKLDSFQSVMNVNTTGMFLCNKYQLRQMIQQSPIEVRTSHRGSIVNCASVNSIQSVVGSVAYTASKHAVVGITKAVRVFLTERLLCLSLSLLYPHPDYF
jgi:NAD(P)-dependent dehydrogenase (short-subunit alcohol dehydrogenase family)